MTDITMLIINCSAECSGFLLDFVQSLEGQPAAEVPHCAPRSFRARLILAAAGPPFHLDVLSPQDVAIVTFAPFCVHLLAKKILKLPTSIIQWPELQSSGQGSRSKAGLAASVAVESEES